MDYEMEELIPIVGRLAGKYTAFESTSVTYERAEQLMEAVLYCIHEAGLCGLLGEADFGKGEGEPDQNSLAVKKKKLSAKQAYEAGAACTEEKTRKALKLYHEILPEFHSYENDCLYETFVKGLPEFFKWYDVKFQPQNTILTLDYPVLKDISQLSGIDKVYEFINCIRLEQQFLKKFSKSYVVETLEQYTRRIIRNMESGGNEGMYSMKDDSQADACPDSGEPDGTHPAQEDRGPSEAWHVEESGGSYEYSRQDIMENLCEIVFTSVLLHILIRKPLSESFFQESEYIRLQEMLSRAELPEIRERLENAAELLMEQYDDGDGQEKTGQELLQYFSGVIDDLAVRLKNAAGSGAIRRMI